MLFLKKNIYKPLYKKLINLRENILNRHKILKFKKKKWKKFIEGYKKKLKWYKKFKPKNQNQYIVSQFPNRYNSYQKKYKNTLQSVKAFRLFFGNFKKVRLKAIIRNIKNKKRITHNFNNVFLEIFERRLDVVLYRAKFFNSLRSAQQYISHGKILVNHKIINKKNYNLNNGDLISLKSKHKTLKINTDYQLRPLPPKNLIINYKTMQIIFVTRENINISTLYPYYLNLEKVFINFYHY